MYYLTSFKPTYSFISLVNKELKKHKLIVNHTDRHNLMYDDLCRACRVVIKSVLSPNMSNVIEVAAMVGIPIAYRAYTDILSKYVDNCATAILYSLEDEYVLSIEEYAFKVGGFYINYSYTLEISHACSKLTNINAGIFTRTLLRKSTMVEPESVYHCTEGLQYFTGFDTARCYMTWEFR